MIPQIIKKRTSRSLPRKDHCIDHQLRHRVYRIVGILTATKVHRADDLYRARKRATALAVRYGCGNNFLRKRAIRAKSYIYHKIYQENEPTF